MRRLTIIGLIFALISITPASVLVCGSVLSPEMILRLNEGHDFHFETDCMPQPSTLNISTVEFSSFLQTGFVAAVFLLMFVAATGHRFFENPLPTIIGFTVSPPTPPPASVFR